MKRIVLKINDLSIGKEQYGVLNHVSFFAGEGKIVALLGLDYSGPELVFQLLQGNLITKWEKEHIYFYGEKVNDFSQIKNQIYYFKDSYFALESWTVAEYINSQKNLLFLLKSTMRKICRETNDVFERFHVGIDPMTKMGDLTELERRKVEIIRAYVRGTKLLLLEDEGEGMTNQDILDYAVFLRNVIDDNMCVLLLTHFKKIFEVLSTDLIIFQKGRIVKKASHINGTIDFDWKSYFLGSALSRKKKTLDDYVKDVKKHKDTIYQVNGIEFAGEKTNLQFKKGEVTSFIILNNKKREEFFLQLSGRKSEESIRYFIDGKEMIKRGTRYFMSEKIISASKLKKQKEIIKEMSIEDNLMIPSARKLNFFEYSLENTKVKMSLYDEFAETFSVDERKAANLSPNEVSAMTLERWLIYKPKVLILFDCFVGNDPYGVSIIQSYIKKFANLGVAVILVKSSLEYAEDLSDRVFEAN